MRSFRNSNTPRRSVHARQPGLAGRWQDENGSILELEPLGTLLTGVYHADFTESGDLDAFDLSGTACGDFLAFTVDLSPHGMLAAFVGQAFPPGQPPEGFHLVWLLTEKPYQENEAGAVLTGSSNFLRMGPDDSSPL